jgi:hypothetical protein
VDHDKLIKDYERIRRKLRYGNPKARPKRDVVNLIRSVSEEWARTYKPDAATRIGETTAIEKVDDIVRNLVAKSVRYSMNSALLKIVGDLIKTYKKAVLPALILSDISSTIPQGRPDLAPLPLRQLSLLKDDDINNGYRQILFDLGDEKRVSYKGTFHEMREVYRRLLDILAPAEAVAKEPWFRESRAKLKDVKKKNQKPTYKERARYCSLKYLGPSSSKEPAGKVREAFEALLENVARPFYEWGSEGAHTNPTKDECVKYLKDLDRIISVLVPGEHYPR